MSTISLWGRCLGYTRRMSRLAVLGLAAWLCLASASSNESQRPPAQPPPGGGPGAGQQAGPRPGGAGWWCHNEQAQSGATAGKIASQCRPAQDACESERASAETSGLAVSPCAQVPQVACFHLGNDPAAAAQWCAASLDDCEFWKRLDEQKNGAIGQRCDWLR